MIWIEIHSPGALPNGLTVEDIKNGTSMPRNMFLFTNANYLLPYTGAGSGVRRALEYDPNVIFSNGLDQREITHSANEFVITIPRKVDQALSETDPVNDKATQNTTKLAQNNDPVNDQPIQNTTKLAQNNDPVYDQPIQNTTKLKLSKKQQDIRNYCSVPRTGKEILQRAGVADHFDSRKRYIYDLVETGVLERTIPDKPNEPNQKYRRKL